MLKKNDFLKVLIIFSLGKLQKLVDSRTFCAKKLFKDFIFFIGTIREVHFNELEFVISSPVRKYR